MKRIILGCAALALIFSASAMTSQADAKGCIKGALVGGVAGHFAGHGKLGAAAGCVIGHHNANKNQQPQTTNGQNPQPTQIQNR